VKVSFLVLKYHAQIFMVSLLVYGKDVKANIEVPMDPQPMHPGRNTVAYEARYLKWLLFEIIDF
jgi:tetratricopeptide repeat protein 30